MQQLKHQNTPLFTHKKQIIIACNFVNSPANLGMICRNAEAFGVHQILLSPANVSFLESNRFKRTARNSDQYIQFNEVASLKEEILHLRSQAFNVSALELTNSSVSLQAMTHSEKLLIVLGNENSGIPEEILSICHQAIHINQFGKNSSINVAQALGISLYEATRAAMR